MIMLKMQLNVLKDYGKKNEKFSYVGIIGHSEGSLIGMLASLESKADFFISISGISRTADQLIIEQLKNSQLSESLLDEALIIIDKLKNDQIVNDVSKELQILFRLSVQPYLISWFKYDASKIIKDLNIPILIVHGKRDIQVPVSDSINLSESNINSKLLVLENMNHILKDSPIDRNENLLTYIDPKLPLSDGLIEGLVNFINEVKRKN